MGLFVNDMEEVISITWKQTKRVVVIVTGSVVLLLGIAMIVLPGPAILVIPAGLAILGSEFLWARKYLNNIKAKLGTFKEELRKKK